MMLRQLEKEVRFLVGDRRLNVASCFDLIVGTGTGEVETRAIKKLLGWSPLCRYFSATQAFATTDLGIVVVNLNECSNVFSFAGGLLSLALLRGITLTHLLKEWAGVCGRNLDELTPEWKESFFMQIIAGNAALCSKTLSVPTIFG